MNPDTEAVNPRSRDIDRKTLPEILRIINDEDHLVADAVKRVLPQGALLVERIAEKLAGGGRLFYVGAGTSGRIGVMDAAECPPTYGVSPDSIIALIAGGPEAVFRARETAEDNAGEGKALMEFHAVCGKDIVVGLSASGSTPFVAAALKEARARGAATAAVLCNAGGSVTENADLAIPLLTGPEVITGSTRMKAASAQKMFLNMVSTAVMIRLGKVTGNFMTSLKPRNKKLRERACFIVSSVTGVSQETSEKLLERNQYDVRETVNALRKRKHGEPRIESLAHPASCKG